VKPRDGTAKAGAPIFFQPGEGAGKGGGGLPVREIGEVIFAVGFRQSFAGGRVQALPFFQRRVIPQRNWQINFRHWTAFVPPSVREFWL
jgi:hypothetical protein